MKKISLFVAAILAFSTAFGANLIKNGDFLNGTADWEKVNCADTDTVNIDILHSGILFPNVFTPSKETNNIFRCMSTNVHNFELWMITVNEYKKIKVGVLYHYFDRISTK